MSAALHATAVGASLLRSEDLPLLTGRAIFVADVDRPGQVWARVVRSDVAHGRLLRVHADAARAGAGVLAVVTAADVPDVRIPLRLEWQATDETRLALQPPLARDRVRYVGEPIAVVVAADRYAAEDAAEGVWAEVEELEPVVDARCTADGIGPALHPALPGNVVNRLVFCTGVPFDDLARRAHVVLRDRFYVHRHAAVPLETRGLVADVEPETGRLVVWGSTKVKHFNRRTLARLLGLAEERIRFVECEVGGGFGARGEFYPEDFLIPWLALRLRRPVKWLEDRREHFVATNHSREQWHEIEVAAAADGRLLGFRDRHWIDLGAYVRTHGLTLPVSTTLHFPGAYSWDGIEIESLAVLTNKTPAGTYRGPGIVEATFVRERMVDLVAGELQLDRAELRRRNLLPADAMPLRLELGGGLAPFYDSGDYPACWEAFLGASGYHAALEERDRARAEGRVAGVGLSSYVEHAAVGPFEQASVVPQADGTFAVQVGVAGVGQGVRTALAQIAADELGVPVELVRVTHHDTDVIPEGHGAFASRGTVFGGNAIALAAHDLLRQSRGELSAAALAERGCVGEGRYENATTEASFGAALALVEVDPETGAVRVLRFFVAFDAGRAVNPALVRGQLVGAAVQGIAGALAEELPYDEHGNPLCASFVDHLMPTAADVPAIGTLVLEYPSGNPLGIRGVGEGGIDGTAGAIANALADALGRPVRSLPLRPEAVKELLETKGAD